MLEFSASLAWLGVSTRSIIILPSVDKGGHFQIRLVQIDIIYIHSRLQ